MSKFTTDKIPNMKSKPKKLGIISTKKRKNMTVRFQNDTIDRLEKLLHRAHEAINYKISRTDIMEALILNAVTERTNTQLKRMLLTFGKG
jgi:hypothetical protein